MSAEPALFFAQRSNIVMPDTDLASSILSQFLPGASRMRQARRHVFRKGHKIPFAYSSYPCYITSHLKKVLWPDLFPPEADKSTKGG
jgi:hypothetical protein